MKNNLPSLVISPGYEGALVSVMQTFVLKKERASGDVPCSYRPMYNAGRISTVFDLGRNLFSKRRCLRKLSCFFLIE